MTMRHAGWVSVWVCLSVAWAAAGDAADPRSVSVEEVRARLAEMPPTHPRLFVRRADAFEKVRAVIDQKPEWKMLRDWIIRDADAVLKQEPVKRVQEGMRMKGQHAVEARVAALAAAYRLTGKPEYAERAKRELLAAAAFENWNPSHFLDTAEMTLGVSLGYDWLYDTLDAGTRKTLCEAIREKGLRQALAKTYFWTNLAIATFHQRTTPGIIDNHCSFGWITIFESIAILRVGSQQELHTIQIDRRIAQIAGQVNTANPLGIRSNANLFAGDQSQRRRSVPLGIDRERRFVPGVEPVIVICAIRPAIRAFQLRMATIHTRIGLANHNSLAGDVEFTSGFIHSDHG